MRKKQEMDNCLIVFDGVSILVQCQNPINTYITK